MASTSTTKKGRKSNGEKTHKPKKPEVSDESDPESEYDPHGTWNCPACTFANRFEAFKCEICDTRKGTSTRKPRLNSNVVQQQALVQAMSQEKVHKRTRTSTNRALTPDGIDANPGSVNSKRESSVGSNHVPEIGSPSSTSSKDKEIETTVQKREKIRDSVILRESAKKYEIVDSEDEGVIITITAFKSRHADKELSSINMLKELEVMEAKHREKVDKARAEFDEEKKGFVEAREKYRMERAARPKRVKRPKKIRVPKKPKLKALKSGAITKTPNARGRPSTAKQPKPGGTRGGKATPGSSKKK